VAHESPPTEFVSALQLGWKQQRHPLLHSMNIPAAQMRRCFAWWEEDETSEHASQSEGESWSLVMKGTLAALVASENVGSAISGSMRRSQMRHFEILVNSRYETLIEITYDWASADL
jgi:hypothetical protein